MKKVLIIYILTILLCSCSYEINPKITLNIEIPSHPWEVNSSKLWYTLKWSAGGELHKLHIDSNTRTIKLTVSGKQTVLIALYPLGSLNPYGGYYLPYSNSNKIKLSQQNGVLIENFFRLNSYIRGELNVPAIKTKLNKITIDYRLVNFELLLAALNEDNLKAEDLKIYGTKTLKDFIIPSGLYISENVLDPDFYIFENKIKALKLTPGCHSYYNFEKNLEFVAYFDGETEKVSTYLKTGILY